MNAKDEGQQWPYQAWENGGNGAIVRYRRDGSEPQMADADYLNALQQQVTELDGKAALADLVISHLSTLEAAKNHLPLMWARAYVMTEIIDAATALTSPSTIAHQQQR